MNRVWNFLSRMDIGFWLLIAVSGNLFVGVIITTLHDPDFKKLNSMLMLAWIEVVSSRPWLYLWLITLFVLLLLLAVNTLLCTASYIKTLYLKNSLMKKLGIILFHVAFLFALGGHCMSEFTGMSEQVLLDEGTATEIPGTGITIETLKIDKITPVINNKVARLGIEASLKAVTPDGNTTALNIKTMNPRFLSGYAFHLSFMDKGLNDNQAHLIVSRDYGLFLIIAAGITAFIAILFYVRYTLPSRRGA